MGTKSMKKKKTKRVNPRTDSIIGYKKVVVDDRDYILKLKIPAAAKRVFPRGLEQKARAEYCYVLDAWISGLKTNAYGDTTWKKTKKKYFLHVPYAGPDTNGYFEYRMGKKIVPHDYDGNGLVECGAGINFFLDIQKAKDY